jgi:hypothetical protein
MSRHIKSETRTISNRGPFPRYIGYFPSFKFDGPYLPFDSISCLLVGIYLEWLKRIVKLSFEKARHQLTVDGVSFEAIPDYTGTLDTGEEELAEASMTARLSSPRRQKTSRATRKASRSTDFDTTCTSARSSKRTDSFKPLRCSDDTHDSRTASQQWSVRSVHSAPLRRRRSRFSATTHVPPASAPPCFITSCITSTSS